MMRHSILWQIQLLLEKMNLQQNSYRQVRGVRSLLMSLFLLSPLSLSCFSSLMSLALSFFPIPVPCLSPLYISPLLSLSHNFPLSLSHNSPPSLSCLSSLFLLPYLSFFSASSISLSLSTACLPYFSTMSLIREGHRKERQEREVEKRDRGEK